MRGVEVFVAGLFVAWPAVAGAPSDIAWTPRGCDVRALRGVARPPPPADSLVSAVRPLVVRYQAGHANSAAIAPVVLEALEQAWDLQVDQLGFRPPVLPDAELGPELDVYLIDYAEWSAYVAGDSYVDAVPGDGHNGTSAYMVIDRRLPVQAVPSYTAHEFNHVLQFATDFSEWSLPIWEATATAAQEWTHGFEGHWDYDIPSFQEAPGYSALTADGYAVFQDSGLGWTFEYGAALWVMFLDETYRTSPGAGGVDLWEAAANEGLAFEPDVVDAVATVAGAPLGDVMGRLALARFLTGEDWDERGLSYAADWGKAEAVPAESVAADEIPFDRAPVAPPQILGQAFFDVALAGAGAGPDDALTVSVTSASSLDSALTVAWWADDGSVGDAVAWGSAPVLNLGAGGLVRAMVAVTNLGPPGWDGDANPYLPGDHVVHLSIEAPPPSTGDTDDTGVADTAAPPPAADGVPSQGGNGGCGCAASPRISAWAGVMAILLAARRRNR